MSRILSEIGYNIKNEKYEMQLSKDLGTIPLLYNEDDIKLKTQNYVTYFAVEGAEYAINKINNLNKINFISDLNKFGVKKIDHQKLDTLLSFILNRLELIKNAKISPFDQPIEGQIFTKYSNNMKTLDDKKYLVFLNEILDKGNSYTFEIEICNYKLNNCEKEYIGTKNLIKLLDQQVRH